MGANNHKKFLSPAEVNHVQGLVKMRGHDSRSLAAATGYARSAIIKVLNGDRCMPRARGAIAQVLGLPEAALFPGPAAAGPEPLPELGAPGGGQ
jgi:lambda repressor-like predicted transcriptional regulator